MKKYILGTLALAIALGTMAFIDHGKPKPKENEKVQTQYVWFEVQPGKAISCASGTVNISDLVPRPKSSENPLTDMPPRTQQQQESATGCAIGLPFLCAVGYLANASNFTPSGNNWIPTTSATIQVRICRTNP